VEILDTDIETMSRTLLFLEAGDYNDDSVSFLGKGIPSLPSNGNWSEAADDDSTLIGSPSNQPRITTTSANPQPERSSIETTTQQVKQLLANGWARNLEIDGLVTLGQTKFILHAQNPFSAAALLEAARLIFDKTKPGDMGLRAQVLRLCQIPHFCQSQHRSGEIADEA